MYRFDEWGCLYPYQEQPSDIPTIFHQLVERFPTSSSRASLYHEWVKYNRLLRGVAGTDFRQWINGSFVTQKTNPKDIDVVSFIPFRAYERNEAVLDKFWTDTWEAEGIDAYLVKVYPPEQPGYTERTQTEEQQWRRRYSATKPDQDFVSHPKGFLSIIVS